MKLTIAGASGFMGRAIRASYAADGAEVRTIGRTGVDATWDDPGGLVQAVHGADILVNLAGKSVNCRYGPANRDEILRSRVATTRALAEAVARATEPPAVWFNASTATIYRHAEDRPMTEAGGEIGSGFSVDVATAWEREFYTGELPGTRRVALRMAIVLGDGSALLPLIRLTRLGLGGAQLDGRWPATAARRAAGTFHEFRARRGLQKFSWVHIADVLAIIQFVRDHPQIDGVVNAAAPNPSDNRTMMRSLRDVLRVPIGVPAPRWMLEIGSAIIRTETELVLKSRWVIPQRLAEAGYRFRYPDLKPALAEITAGRIGGP